MINGEDLLDVLAFLDDELIIAAGKKRVNRKRIIVIRASVAAACVALLVITALLVRLPFDRTQQILAGKDWRFFKDDKRFELVLPESTEKPGEKDEQLATQTEEPSVVTEEPAVPTNRPTVPTNRPTVQTSVPTTKSPDLDPVTPDKSTTDSSGDSDNADNSGVSPTNTPTGEPVPTRTPDEWITYIAKSNMEVGTSSLVGSNILAWFGADLDYVGNETRPPEMGTPPPPVDATEEPTPPTYTSAPLDPPVYTVSPEAPPVYTDDPSEPPGPTISPSDPSYGNPMSPGNQGNSSNWKYQISVNSTWYTWKKYEVAAADIERYLFDVALQGRNSASWSKEETVSAYKIKGVSADAAVAVNISGMDGYYLFYNQGFAAPTLKEYMNAYNMTEYLTWDTLGVYYNYGQDIKTVKNKSDAIKNILASADGPEEDSSRVYWWNSLTAVATVDFDTFGYESMPVALYEEGYIMFKLFDRTTTYYIGPEKVAEIKALVE